MGWPCCGNESEIRPIIIQDPVQQLQKVTYDEPDLGPLAGTAGEQSKFSCNRVRLIPAGIAAAFMDLSSSMDSVSFSLSPGMRFGSYEILQRLGAGGMGEVYRAKDTRLDREVAIKTVSVMHHSSSETLSRFEREARSASALNHPHIVTIYELGSVEGKHYIAMELVAGKTLRELLDSGPVPFRKAITFAAQIADALAKAHEVGIVHRDLKPENLMVSEEGA